ncbi:hypothetical protein NQ315_004056 [Exocentrus adspersus]|uniref:Uncharacterized protein n=1 Tax=Exocentrus adspersus TaxID=1586481 RepID=A0AAV8W726_9CUCU|nr:hypothetical protein NQ315_004056 [Exocentrus adspersus]
MELWALNPVTYGEDKYYFCRALPTPVFGTNIYLNEWIFPVFCNQRIKFVKPEIMATWSFHRL